MSNLLRSLEKKNLLYKYIDDIDWFLNGKFFEPSHRWTKKRKDSFTRRISKLIEKECQTGSASTLDFTPINHHSKQKKTVFTDGNGKGLSFLKHIRNGIAHGHANLYFPKTPYIEIRDYQKSGEQTAYFYIPLDYLTKIIKIYRFVETS